MKYILTFVVIAVVLAVLIFGFSQMPIGGVRIYKVQFAIIGFWDRIVHFFTSMSDKEEGGTVSKPSSIIITRIEVNTDDIEKVVRGEIPYSESFLMTVDDFPVKMGRENPKGKITKLEKVLPIVSCSIDDGVSRKHIRLNRNFDAQNKNISYSVENIAECNEIVYYCNDNDIPEDKKYGVLFNNGKGDLEDDNRDCLIFKNSITLVLGQAILRFYKKTEYTKVHGFTFKIGANKYNNADKKDDTGIVVPTGETGGEATLDKLSSLSETRGGEEKKIVIKKRAKESRLD